MVSIQSLEVRFDVEGSDDEVVFARLFERHFGRSIRRHEEEKMRSRNAESTRSLGGSSRPTETA